MNLTGTCARCLRNWKVDESLAGKSLRCECGETFQVPAVARAKTAVADRKIAVQCNACQRTYQVAISLSGKSVKCPCGQTTRVPVAAAVAVGPSAPSLVSQAPATPVSTYDPLDPLALPPVEASTVGGSASVPWATPAGAAVNKSAHKAPVPRGQATAAKRQSGDDVLKQYMSDDSWRKPESEEHGELNLARWILIVVGALTILFNGGTVIYASVILEKALAEDPELIAAAPAEIEQVRQIAIVVMYACLALGVFVGVALIACGVFVHRYPVPATVTGLTIYLVATLLGGWLDPTSLLRGIIIKLLIIGALAKAVYSAVTLKS